MNSIISFIGKNYSLLLSTFAILISVTGLIYSYQQNKKYKPNLEIKLDNQFSCEVLRPCDKYTWGKANCIIRCSIINKSAYPISIYKITDDLSENANYSVSHENHEYASFYKGINHTIDLHDQLDLPLRLDSYDTFKGTIFFPSFRKLMKGETINVFFFTSRGTFKQEIKILESFVTKVLQSK